MIPSQLWRRTSHEYTVSSSLTRRLLPFSEYSFNVILRMLPAVNLLTPSEVKISLKTSGAARMRSQSPDILFRPSRNCSNSADTLKKETLLLCQKM